MIDCELIARGRYKGVFNPKSIFAQNNGKFANGDLRPLPIFTMRLWAPTPSVTLAMILKVLGALGQGQDPYPCGALP